MDPVFGRVLYALLPAPIWPPLILILAVSDQITASVIAGFFSLINTVLLAVLTVRYARTRRSSRADEQEDHDPAG